MSRYLYSQENKNLYEETLDEFNNKSCVFSRTLIAQLESSQLKQGPFFQKHIKECKVCQTILEDYSSKEKELKAKIPVVSAPDYLVETLRPELRQSLAYLQVKSEERNKPIVTKRLVLKSLKEFVTTVPKSRTFLNGLVLAFFSFVALKFFL